MNQLRFNLAIQSNEKYGSLLNNGNIPKSITTMY